jgi:hypothetical protein
MVIMRGKGGGGGRGPSPEVSKASKQRATEPWDTFRCCDLKDEKRMVGAARRGGQNIHLLLVMQMQHRISITPPTFVSHVP